jgi:hypothetical protein
MAKKISELTETFTATSDDLAEVSQYVSVDNYTSKKVAISNLLAATTNLTNPIQFNINPTIGDFSEGKIYYDNVWHTFSFNTNNTTLQIGQEDYRYVYNNSGVEIPDGKAVYTTGAYTSEIPNVATIALARSDIYETSIVLGISTQVIPNNSYGFVTVRGTVNNIKTDYPTWVSGDIMYLSGTVAGDLINALPEDPNLHIRVGRVISIHPTAGSINVRITVNFRLQDLADALQTSPNDGDMVVREGNTWVYKPAPQSSGMGVTVFLDNTPSEDDYQTVTRSPVTSTPTQTASAVVNSSTELLMGFLYPPPQNRMKLEGGIWKFNTYAYVSSGADTSTIIIGTYRVMFPGGTVEITGSDPNSRTATLSSYAGTPFISGDANSDKTLSGYVQSASGTFQITAFTNDHEVTIYVPTGFVNPVSPETYSVHRYLFQAETGKITQTGTPILTTVNTLQPEFTYSLTDTTAFRYYAKTTSLTNKTVYMTYNGSTAYSYIETSVSIRHNELSGLNSGDYQHLTAAEYAGTGTGDFVKETSPTINTPTLDDITVNGPLTLSYETTPSSPSAGYEKLYFKSDEQLYKKNSAGQENLVIGRAIIIDSQKNTLSTNVYLNGPDGTPMNVVPFILPNDCYLVAISAATDGAETWTAEIHVNGVLKTGAILSLSSVDNGYGEAYSGVASFGAGDKIMTYCNGTSISKPRITAFFRRA